MPETLAQTTARLTSLIQTLAPNIDTSPGSVFNELMIGIESQVQNQVYNDLEAISASQSIATVLASATDTFNPIIDAIASNYNIIRKQGQASSGIIQVTVSRNQTYSIPIGLTFTQPNLGYTYTTTASTVINTPLQQLNGNYVFQISVQATLIGAKQTISNGSQFILSNTSQIPGFVSAVAAGNFTAGADTETDKELIARFRLGLSTNNLLSNSGITSQLTANYPGFKSLYLADSLSSINLRSISPTLGIKVPGCVDVYVQEANNITQSTLSYTGIWDSVNHNYYFDMPATDAPGFYRIDNIQDASAVTISLLPFSVTYNWDTSASNFIDNSASARFSVYQTAHVVVSYAYQGSTPPTFEVTVIAPPDLASIQSLFLNSSNRTPCADYLVKGIIPCIVNLSLSLIANTTGPKVDTVALQGDVFNYINELEPGQPIVVSQIVKLCHNYNISRVDLPIVLNGRILAPYSNASSTDVSDQDVIIRGTDFLTIPELPAYGVSAANTAFFITYFNDNGLSNINITIN